MVPPDLMRDPPQQGIGASGWLDRWPFGVEWHLHAYPLGVQLLEGFSDRAARAVADPRM
jgi:hypothetical protein